MKTIILILITSFINLHALTLSHHEIKNANTVLLKIKEKNISDVKLTFDKQNIDFFENPFDKNSFYALLPISYYQDLKDYRIIISYIKNGKKVFKGSDLKVINANYKSETINVEPSKFKPNKEDKKLVKRTKQEYTEAMNIYNSISKNIYWNKDFVYPLHSKITSNFGTKRIYNGTLKSYHSGTDFKAKENTAITASNDGIVRISQNRFYSGNSIIIDHGHGVYSGYFHLNTMNFKVGEKVKRGDVIGLSGSTGRVTGPHLHFSFRINGLQVDPLQAIEILNKLKNNV